MVSDPQAPNKPKALVVGSGPTGLVFATTLLKHGIAVDIIEKSLHQRMGQRGAGITPRSLEVFESLGVIQDVMQRSLVAPPLRFYKMPQGTEVLKEMDMVLVSPDSPSIPYPTIRMLGQDSLDAILRAQLSDLGCCVQFGVELTELTEAEHSVCVKLTKRLREGDQGEVSDHVYDWVLGADGGGGVVRKLLDLSFLGETVSENYIVADLKLEGLDTQRWHFWGSPKDIVTGIRATEHHEVFNVIVGGTNLQNFSEICANADSFFKFLREHTGNQDSIVFKELQWLSVFKPQIRMVDTFRKGRVFVAGDAAHVHSPAGGQGMNSGIQDSFNLAWKLSLVIQAVSDPSLLDTYNEERLPVIAHMLNLTTSIYKQTLSVTSDGDDGWKRGGNLFQLGVNYRWSSIVVDHKSKDKGDGISSYDASNAAVRAGDRAPDATGLVHKSSCQEPRIRRLFEILTPTSHTVLIFSQTVDKGSVFKVLDKFPHGDFIRAIAVVSQLGSANVEHDVILDEEGYLQAAYAGNGGIVVIRPDGFIGAIVEDIGSLYRYFKAIFLYADPL